MPPPPDLDTFRAEARAWLDANAERKPEVTTADDEVGWGVGDDDVAVFLNLGEEEERARIEAARAWQQAKYDAGFGAISWPVEHGGRGLPVSYLRAFNQEEARFVTPNPGELFPTSMGLVAPTIAAFGTPQQRDRFLRPMLRAEILACQLFSEPGAGSDLASLACRAERDGDQWVLNGQKVWTSGARFAQWGEALCRSDPSLPKHTGITAFLVPLGAPGVEVRPIRQMTGGSNFNEVFLTDVRIADELRLGAEGEGWRVGLTTLGFERDHSGGGGPAGGGFTRVLALARHLGRTDEPVVRQALAGLYARQRLMQLTTRRAAAALRAGQTPGPEGSLGKLLWTEGMRRTSDVVSLVLGPRLVADTGEWGTYAWAEQVLGAPGYRIAGGSDEIQRSIIGERVLGLPKEPQVDKGAPFAASRRAG
ncbi:MAG: acyl-CoA dehydrogenase family protein [Acidimicrobiales bacterium]|nr:acyl-CoA dehydrogenase family protein [Acidimicrobiales bacterium]